MVMVSVTFFLRFCRFSFLSVLAVYFFFVCFYLLMFLVVNNQLRGALQPTTGPVSTRGHTAGAGH